jgi:hypothetical protein
MCHGQNMVHWVCTFMHVHAIIDGNPYPSLSNFQYIRDCWPIPNLMSWSNPTLYFHGKHTWERSGELLAPPSNVPSPIPQQGTVIKMTFSEGTASSTTWRTCPGAAKHGGNCNMHGQSWTPCKVVPPRYRSWFITPITVVYRRQSMSLYLQTI